VSVSETFSCFDGGFAWHVSFFVFKKRIDAAFCYALRMDKPRYLSWFGFCFPGST